MPPISAEAERRIMSKRISETKHEYNTDFDKLLSDIDHGKVSTDKSPFFTRPAYYGTKQCVKPPAAVKNCNDCAYFFQKDDDYKKRCRFPWNNQKEWDKVVFNNLPCQK